MIGPISVVILVALVLTTLALLYYSRVMLPRELDGKVRESLRAFGTAVELRFPSHKGLTDRVCVLSREVGIRMGLSSRQLKRLEMAARLRDLGLCSIPYSLINQKPMVEWTPAEQSVYDRHPEVSAAMLELVPSLRHLAHIVRNHHIQFDGSSGPYFPCREEIPIESRVLKVISEYVWLERMQGTFLAREILRDLSGTSFDPKVVDVFLGMLTSVREREFVPERVHV